MSTRKTFAAAALATCLAACAAQTGKQGGGPNLGRAATPEELAAWDMSIPPSGAGLPQGSGTAREGASVYGAKCVSCHGERGAGKPADPLVGGIGTLSKPQAKRTVGSYWPYSTTLFDYVRRAMPLNAPRTLTSDEIYAVSAYILYLNGIVAEDASMNAATLPMVRMPNRDGFIDAWKEKQ
jgi:cytochrome c